MKTKLLTTLLALTLGACGGGGGGGGNSSSSAPAPSVLQGVYQGTLSTGTAENSIVLEDGTFWNIYGVLSGATLLVQGVATGTSNANNGTFTMSFTDFPALGATPVSGQGSGIYSASGLIGMMVENSVTGTFNLTAPVQATYNYGTVAAISSISGSWSGYLLDGETSTISILADGTLSGTSSLGCAFSGTATPRPSGKNIFNVSLTFGAAPCLFPSQTTTGIGITYPLGNGKNQLIVGQTVSGQTKATAFFAVR